MQVMTLNTPKLYAFFRFFFDENVLLNQGRRSCFQSNANTPNAKNENQEIKHYKQTFLEKWCTIFQMLPKKATFNLNAKVIWWRDLKLLMQMQKGTDHTFNK